MRRRFGSTGRQTCGEGNASEPMKMQKKTKTKTVALETVFRLTGVHVRSVGQRLGLPPKTDGFLLLLLLLLQDEPTQVGLDLGVNTVSRYTASVGFGRRRDVFFFLARRAPTLSSSCSCSVLASSVRSSNSSSSSSFFFFHSISARIHSQVHSEQIDKQAWKRGALDRVAIH